MMLTNSGKALVGKGLKGTTSSCKLTDGLVHL